MIDKEKYGLNELWLDVFNTGNGAASLLLSSLTNQNDVDKFYINLTYYLYSKLLEQGIESDHDWLDDEYTKVELPGKSETKFNVAFGMERDVFAIRWNNTENNNYSKTTLYFPIYDPNAELERGHHLVKQINKVLDNKQALIESSKNVRYVIEELKIIL